MELTETEAQNFINMPKKRKNENRHTFPDGGEQLKIDLISEDEKQDFILDIQRGRINLLKCSYQNRVMTNIPLVRLDINGQPHRNPDDILIGRSHLHLYKENYGLKWAIEIPINFSDTSKLDIILQEFMNYCKIIEKPIIDNIYNI